MGVGDAFRSYVERFLLVRRSVRGVDCCRSRRRFKFGDFRCFRQSSSVRSVTARRKAYFSGCCVVTVCGFFIRFVLKYGLRSLICVRVDGF